MTTLYYAIRPANRSLRAPTDDRHRAVCANDTPIARIGQGERPMPPHERERPPHRVGRLVPERIMSPGPRPKCVRRDQAPRLTSAYIYMVSSGLRAWLKLIHSPNRSYRPVVGPSIQGRFEGTCALSARNGTPSSARPPRSWRSTHKATSASKIRLAPQRPCATSRSHRERGRPNRVFARRGRFTVLWSSELNFAQSRRFIVCLGKISNKFRLSTWDE